VLSILRNEDGHPVYAQYRHALARSILTKGAMMEDTPTSNAKDFMGRTDNHCRSASWAGNSGVAWLDVSLAAAEGMPQHVSLSD
jgi:hypothetical protein